MMSMLITLGQMSENGRYLPAYALGSPTDEQDQTSLPRTVIYDLDACDGESCATVESFGFPIWSPNEENVLILPFDNFDFFTQLADDRVWHSGDRSLRLTFI